jgi:catechol 2,3-dioxygenase-like lactoylglutathione lyase family enzyme
MGKRLRTGDPWMPGYRYGALLPPLSLNLIVSNVDRSVEFYRQVLGATIHYCDIDFAALRVGPAELMLHADHTHEEHPWHEALASGAARGVGAQVRLLGVDPDEVERRARAVEATLIAPAISKGHGWRETLVRDPDGYEWAVGIVIDPPTKPPASK